MFANRLPRSSSGQDAALSRLKQEFDSPTGRQKSILAIFLSLFQSRVRRLPSHAFDGISGGILAADGMQLSDKAIRALKPKEKASKATGGQCLHILVTTQGSRLWRFDYRWFRRPR